MSTVAEIEMSRHHDELVKDVDKMLDKYLKKIEWSVPDVSEAEARGVILADLKETLQKMES